jgi:CheY-like chemotaxis protein
MLNQMPELISAVSAIITALATLIWPAIVILLIFFYRSSVGKLIESAEKREWAMEVGGQKISMKELTTQQTALITDLQKQLNELQTRVEMLSGPAIAAEAQPAPPEAAKPFAVLWVDDKPSNNAIFLEQLKNAGVKTDLALSTTEGMNLFNQNRYRLVISDMGRTEDGVYRPEAGIEMTKQIRTLDSEIPVIIYSSSQAARRFKSSAETAGVTEVTSSPSRVAKILSDYGLTQAT